MQIAITIVITFIVTVVWQKWVDRKGKLPLKVVLQGMHNDLDVLAQRAGYEDAADYWESEKGQTYAQVAQMNFNETLRFLG